MTDLTQREIPFELVVCWDTSGKLAATLLSMQVVVTDGETVIAQKVGSPGPLSSADVDEKSDLGRILAMAGVGFQAQVAEKDAEIERLQRKVIAPLEAEIGQWRAAAAKVYGQIQAALGKKD